MQFPVAVSTASPKTLIASGLIKVESWLLDTEEEGGKIDTFPEEFYDVVVMAGHEL